MSDRCVVLLGTPIDDVTLPEAIDRIGVMVDEGRRSGRVHQVATVNVDFVVNASRDATLRSILQRSDLAIPDGMGVVWAARIVGIPIRERTSGADLVPALAERAAREHWRLCLFGAAPGVAERAAQILIQRFQGVDVVGLEAPAIDADGSMDAATADVLRNVRADLIAVALGNPKQERWIARNRSAIGVPVYIGIGGSLDFLTGVTRRAPEWMQRSGLEWIHRAASEPRRLAGRYAKDLVFFGPGLLAQAWRGRRRDPSATVVVERDDATTAIDLTTVTALDNLTAADLAGHVRAARRRGDGILLVGGTDDPLTEQLSSACDLDTGTGAPSESRKTARGIDPD